MSAELVAQCEDFAIEVEGAIEAIKPLCWNATDENLDLRNALLGLRGALARWNQMKESADA